MPRSLSPIPSDQEITERGGPITVFFRLRWQELIDSVTQSPTLAEIDTGVLDAALATTTAKTVIAAGIYRIGLYLQKITADGVSSSLTLTVGWTSRGQALTHSFAALTTDAIGANDSSIWEMYVDANSDITYAVAYASNTAGLMTYRVNGVVEYLP